MREEAGAPGEPWAPAKDEENTCKRILENAPIYQYLMATSNVRGWSFTRKRHVQTSSENFRSKFILNQMSCILVVFLSSDGDNLF